MTLAETLKRRALEIGFDLVGIAPLAVWKDLEFSRQWVERGYGGGMRYLENPKRDDPRRILPSAQSVVCVGLVYNAPFPYSTQVADLPLTPSPSPQGRGWPRSAGPGEGTPRAWISRYAWGADYHEAMRAELERLRAATEALAPGVETRVYVDTGPIVERAFARYSGIGWTGKNTCLINERKGSWFFLGVMLSSLPMEPDLPAPDRCGSCTRCIEACPTGALVEPYLMDASRCIAYLNIELKGSIPTEFRSAMGANVFGCDICQDVCPWNSPRRAAVTHLPEFQPVEVKRSEAEGHSPSSGLRSHSSSGRGAGGEGEHRAPAAFNLFNPPLEALADLTEEDFRKIFRRSPLKRAKYRGWLRNVCVAMGNSGDARFVPRLERLREHPDPIAREHAAWALEQLAK